MLYSPKEGQKKDMLLRIEHSFDEVKNHWNVKIQGEADISNAPEFRQALNAIYQEKKADIWIFLQDLLYMDSTGLGVIIGACGRMRATGHEVVLCNPRDNVKKLLSITNLDRILHIENTEH